MFLPEIVRWKGTLFRLQVQVLVGRTAWIVVETLDASIRSSQRDVVEATDGKG